MTEVKKELTIKDYTIMYSNVLSWNTIAGNKSDDPEVKKLYLKLSQEEFFGKNEFLEGWLTEDKEKIIDGVCDLIFTVFKYCKCAETTNHDSDTLNYAKKWEEDKIVAMLSANLITGEVDSDLLTMFLVKMNEHFDLESAFEEVSKSNFSKFINIFEQKVDVESEKEYITSQGRYGNIEYKEVDGYGFFTAGKDLTTGTVFDKPKLVKPSTFKEPQNLIQYWYE